MSKENYTFDDLDDILAEFSGKTEFFTEPVEEPEAVPAVETAALLEEKTIKIDAIPAAKPVEKPAPATMAEKAAPDVRKPEPAEKRSKAAGSSFAEFEALFSRESIKKEAKERRAAMNASAKKAPAAKPEFSFSVDAPAAPAKKNVAVKSEIEEKPAKNKKPKKEKPAKPERVEKPELPVEEYVEQAPAKKFSALHGLLSIAFAVVGAAMLAWVLFNVHPASGSVTAVDSSSVLKLSEKLDVYMNNVASDALGELAYIKKIYTLQESDTVAPIPNPENFGRTTDVAVIQDLIKRAAPLLEGQTVTFDPNADFVPDTEFMYYLDDTIMVIAWKEYINERCCTMAEVKVAHGSQIRRKLAEDSYSSSVQYYASDMAKQSNAVIAINGDFYAFRDLGITVYQRNLYRNNPATVDSCFFTASGDMLFSRAGELMGEGEAQRFIEENDVVFAIAFGPVLVDNGELQYCESYPIGEINTEYSRSCIGMTDDLHYLLMTINHTPDARPRATINELARYIYSKGVEKAYTLDGGQTAEIVMFGAPINHVDFGFERTVSDIIYFATAIPNEEVR